jgi:hypothetical protein
MKVPSSRGGISADQGEAEAEAAPLLALSPGHSCPSSDGEASAKNINQNMTGCAIRYEKMKRDALGVVCRERRI